LANFHQSLIEITRMPSRKQLIRSMLDRAAKFCLVDISAQCQHPRHNPRHVAVEDCVGLRKGDAKNSSRRIVSDAGERANRFPVTGKTAIMFTHKGLRGTMKIASPPVVAKPRPSREDFLGRSLSERPDIRKSTDEAAVIGNDRVHLCLLQHDFG
jgi:hypothetical protein